MPGSRSTKEICQDDPKGIACMVAQDRDRRRASEGTAEPMDEKPVPPVATAPPTSIFDRGKQLEEKIKKAGG